MCKQEKKTDEKLNMKEKNGKKSHKKKWKKNTTTGSDPKTNSKHPWTGLAHLAPLRAWPRIVDAYSTGIEEFKSSRGIRQGDPIWPYLFLLAIERLSGLPKSRNQSSEIDGIQVAPLASCVNSLLFADDSLLFFKANGLGSTEVSNLLHSYCVASGQIINTSKYSIFFIKGCRDNIREEVKGILNVPNATFNERYLGMPSDVGTSKNGSFKLLKDRLWAKVKGWIEKTISSAGKEILIKSDAQD